MRHTSPASALLITFLCSIIFFSSLAIATSITPNPHPNLKTLTRSTFRDYLSKYPTTLIFFHADTCSQCESSLTEFSLANDLNIADQRARLRNPTEPLKNLQQFVSVNCSDHDQEDLCIEYTIEGFPTILAVKFPKYYEEYTGARIAAKLYRYFKYSAQPLVPQITNIHDYLDYISSDIDSEDFIKCILHIPEHIETGLLSGNSDAISSYQLYRDKAIDVAHKYRTILSLSMVNQTLIRANLNHPSFTAKHPQGDGYTHYPSSNDDMYLLELYRSFDEPHLQFFLSKPEDIEEFYQKSSLPLFGTISPQNYNSYLQRKVPLVWVFYDYTNTQSPQIQEYTTMFIQLVSTISQDKLLFVKIDSRLYADHAKSFGIHKNTLTTPGLVIEDRLRRKNYVFDPNNKYSTIPLSRLQHWFNTFLASTLQHSIRSEPDDRHLVSSSLYIKSIVGRHYDKYVNVDTVDKDLFVIYYTSWCTQTPKLRDKFIDLLNNTSIIVNGQNTTTIELHDGQIADKSDSIAQDEKISNNTITFPNVLKYDRNLLIAQIDIGLNDLPYHLLHDLDITRTPTLYFFPAGRSNATNATTALTNNADNSTTTKKRTKPLKYNFSIDTESLYAFIPRFRNSQPNFQFPVDSSASINGTGNYTIVDTLQKKINSQVNRDEL